MNECYVLNKKQNAICFYQSNVLFNDLVKNAIFCKRKETKLCPDLNLIGFVYAVIFQKMWCVINDGKSIHWQ